MASSSEAVMVKGASDGLFEVCRQAAQLLDQVKRAADEESEAEQLYAGHPTASIQQFSPQLGARTLTRRELQAIAEGESQWLPRIFQSYGTPIAEMMSSPGKGAILAGGLGALGGGLLGHGLGQGRDAPYLGAGIGALGVGVPWALAEYLRRQSQNEGLRSLMERLPPNPIKRDLLADPAYQADLERESRLHSGMLLGRALAAAMR
jgi:hypothetical protein